MSDFTVEIEHEDDGRWISEVTDLPEYSRTVLLAMKLSRKPRLWRSECSLIGSNMAKTFQKSTVFSPSMNELARI